MVHSSKLSSIAISADPSPSEGALRRHLALVLPLLIAISVFYAFLASSGRFTDLPGIQTNYYDRMAEGFRHGHLYIDEQPDPALLAQANPFADENMELWLWDATLVHGHYYLYWGPVPALLLLAFKLVSRHSGEVTDQWPTLLFMLGRLYAGAGLILALAHYMRMRRSTWLVGLSVAAFGLASPAPFIVARPHVYEAGLAAGQCFLMVGMCAALAGVVRARVRTRCFLLAGVFWSLAIGSRITMLFAVPALIATTALVVWFPSRRNWISLLRDALAMSVPVAATLVGYAYYNHARFGSVLEFGTTHQVTLQRFTTAREHILPNLYSYLLAPVEWSCRFPFVSAPRYRPLPDILFWPSSYLTFENVSGLLITSSWCWLVAVALLRPLSACYCAMRDPVARLESKATHPELWAIISGFAVLPAILPVLGLWEASMRYSADALGGLLIIATVTAFWLKRRTDGVDQLLLTLPIRGGLVLLGLHTCFVGSFLAFASYNEPFKQNNPLLYESLEEQFSFCNRSR